MGSGAAKIDWHTLGALTFEAPNAERFPGLPMAWQVLNAAAGTPAVLNAANEVAVQAFLDERIGFTQIHAVNCATLAAVLPSQITSLGDLLELDARARSHAETELGKHSR